MRIELRRLRARNASVIVVKHKVAATAGAGVPDRSHRQCPPAAVDRPMETRCRASGERRSFEGGGGEFRASLIMPPAMFRCVASIVVLLLLIVLPLQGVAAVAMLHCGPAHERTGTIMSTHVMTAHAHPDGGSVHQHAPAAVGSIDGVEQ